MRYIYILPVTSDSLFVVALFWCHIKVILKAVYKTVNDDETVPCYTVTECENRETNGVFGLLISSLPETVQSTKHAFIIID